MMTLISFMVKIKVLFQFSPILDRNKDNLYTMFYIFYNDN